MLGPLSSVTVYVSDVDRALAFYVDVLGMEKGTDAKMGPMRWVEVAPRGAETVVVLTGPGFETWAPEKVGVFTGLIFRLTDGARTFENLQARGVTFTSPPEVAPWGLQVVFTDPDGNVLVAVGS